MLARYPRLILQTLWHHGPLSRWELHQHTGLTPNQVGEAVATLLRDSLVREEPPRRRGRGRPAVPVSIDEQTRHVLGLAIQPGQVSLTRLNLHGQRVSEPVNATVRGPVDGTGDEPAALVDQAAQLVRTACREAPPVAIGLSLPGFVDPTHHSAMLSVAWRGEAAAASQPGRLKPIYDAAGEAPIALDNDVHALTARRLLTHPKERREDLLVVHIEDGRLGATLVIGGRPNRGCVTGANEMGHTRFFADTERCYCGQIGCLERIVSTAQLHRLGAAPETTLAEQARHYQPNEDQPFERVLDYLACGLANAINFIRPERLILVSSLLTTPAVQKSLWERTLAQTIAPIGERVHLETDPGHATSSAEAAGWLAIAELFEGNWSAID